AAAEADAGEGRESGQDDQSQAEANEHLRRSKVLRQMWKLMHGVTSKRNYRKTFDGRMAARPAPWRERSSGSRARCCAGPRRTRSRSPTPDRYGGSRS